MVIKFFMKRRQEQLIVLSYLLSQLSYINIIVSHGIGGNKLFVFVFVFVFVFPSFAGFWYPANNICISLVLVFFYSIVTPSPQLGLVRSIDRLTTLATSMHILRQYPLFPPQGGNRFDSYIMLTVHSVNYSVFLSRFHYNM